MMTDKAKGLLWDLLSEYDDDVRTKEAELSERGEDTTSLSDLLTSVDDVLSSLKNE